MDGKPARPKAPTAVPPRGNPTVPLPASPPTTDTRAGTPPSSDNGRDTAPDSDSDCALRELLAVERQLRWWLRDAAEFAVGESPTAGVARDLKWRLDELAGWMGGHLLTVLGRVTRAQQADDAHCLLHSLFGEARRFAARTIEPLMEPVVVPPAPPAAHPAPHTPHAQGGLDVWKLHQRRIASVVPFGGDVLAFAGFCSGFEAATPGTLPAQQRLTALRSKLVGPPARLLPDSGDAESDLREGWGALRAAYGGSYRLLDAVFGRLLRDEPVPDDFFTMTHYVHNINHWRSLLAAHPEIDLGDFFTFACVFHPLPREVREAFLRRHIVDQEDVPTCHQLMEHLRGHLGRLQQSAIEDTSATRRRPRPAGGASSGRQSPAKPASSAPAAPVAPAAPRLRASTGRGAPATVPRDRRAHQVPAPAGPRVVPAPRCGVCGPVGHQTYQCPDFKTWSVPRRRAHTVERGWCKNCLSDRHNTNACRSQMSCPQCQKRHHTLLHIDTPAARTFVTGPSPSPPLSSRSHAASDHSAPTAASPSAPAPPLPPQVCDSDRVPDDILEHWNRLAEYIRTQPLPLFPASGSSGPTTPPASNK